LKRKIKKIDKLTRNLVVAIAVILLISVALFFISNRVSTQRKSATDNYNGFDFFENDGIWFTYILREGNNYQIPFYYHPTEVEDILMQPGIEDKIEILTRDDNIYISVDPDMTSKAVVAGVNIARITGNQYDLYNIPTHSAFSREPAEASNAPIKTCDDSDETTLVIIFKIGDDNKIYSVGGTNCIVMQAETEDDLLREADRLIYELVGIM
jgi:hypothetical protein